MQDNLDAVLQNRYNATPRGDLADRIIINAHKNNQNNTADKALAFTFFRPRYAYAVLGLIIITAIALLASFPDTEPLFAIDTGTLNDISTYMVYDTLADFTADIG